MPVIDKNMYKKLSEWCWDEESRPEDQRILYVNSNNRDLTDDTIRKVLAEIEIGCQDSFNDIHTDLFSSENFYRNMREYYSHIANLYGNKTSEEDSLFDIIGKIPLVYGDVILVVKDIELLSDKPEEMQKMMEYIYAFSTRYPSIILVFEGEFDTVFAGCKFVLKGMTNGIAVKVDNGVITVGRCDQEANPQSEKLIYDNAEDQCKELNFYWDTIYRQLGNRYFDYGVFKKIFKETLEYIKPRVTEEQVYRKDISLVGYIGAMRKEKNTDLDGCTTWEFDAAQGFSTGLYNAIINQFGYYDYDFLPDEDIELNIEIKNAVEDSEDSDEFRMSNSTFYEININAETVVDEMDKLSTAIYNSVYNGCNGS